MSGDKEMIKTFNNGGDIHISTAQSMFGVDKVDSDMRSRAKVINFGIIYGVSPHGLARQVGCSRTQAKEFIDSYFLTAYKDTKAIPGAKINSESPAWALDRLSILALKIYHMQLETVREDASESHQQNCLTKLNTLLEQRTDLSSAIDDLLEDISSGNKYMKVYKQMKMYNDDELNPVLRGTK